MEIQGKSLPCHPCAPLKCAILQIAQRRIHGQFHPHHPPEDCVNCEHRHLRMFCNLTPEALADYDQIGIMMSHARGAKLFSEGDPARNVFIICFGQVKVSSTSRDGKTMILRSLVPET